MNESASRIPTTADVPLVDTYGSRRRRRTRVIALFGGFVALFPTYAFGYGRHDRVVSAVTLVALVICFAAFCYGFYTLLQRTFVNAANVRDGALDERQRDRRNRAVLLAFRTLAVVLSIAPLWATIGTTATQWTWMRDPSLIAFAAYAVFLLGMTLPTAIMAWNEPDPLPPEPAA